MNWYKAKENDIVKIRLHDIHDKKTQEKGIEMALIIKITKNRYTLKDIATSNDIDLVDYNWVINIPEDIDKYELLEIVAHYPTPEEILSKTHPEYFI